MSAAITARGRFQSALWLVFGTIALGLLSSPGSGLAGEIYKSVDARGRVTYSDRPSPQAERIVIPTDPTLSDADRARLAEDQQAQARLQTGRAQRADMAKQEQARRAEAEQTRGIQCRQARDRYLMFAESGRLYRRDEQGNRVYYTSAELDAERTKAQQRMKELCDAETGR
ncbi:DUF4124 domain-containing protein [Steroidobacter sp.]|uniref:DUF4124 domain-containing protein n=1 Tax=Steroidobacter sp. TaxID=1978227 RepID=UPI001A36A816|nr:DUF4124 domain-containing protein [Steroidobacter sp.]MBL8269765.1 DUF4124 domain-containing protein [Steroidobacter sp.]